MVNSAAQSPAKVVRFVDGIQAASWFIVFCCAAVPCFQGILAAHCMVLIMMYPHFTSQDPKEAGKAKKKRLATEKKAAKAAKMTTLPLRKRLQSRLCVPSCLAP